VAVSHAQFKPQCGRGLNEGRAKMEEDTILDR